MSELVGFRFLKGREMKTIVMMAVLAAFGSWQAFGLAIADPLGIPLATTVEAEWTGGSVGWGEKMLQDGSQLRDGCPA